MAKRLGIDRFDLLAVVGAALVAAALWSIAWQVFALVFGVAFVVMAVAGRGKG